MRLLSLLTAACNLVLPLDRDDMDRELTTEELHFLEKSIANSTMIEYELDPSEWLIEQWAAVDAAEEEEEDDDDDDDEKQNALDARSLEKRACFKTGFKFGNKAMAAKMATSVCYNCFAGTFYRPAKKSRCYNLANNWSVVFTLGLTGPNAPKKKYIGGEECENGMHSEIRNCNRGGQTTYGNWYYRVDPNKGWCK